MYSRSKALMSAKPTGVASYYSRCQFVLILVLPSDLGQEIDIRKALSPLANTASHAIAMSNSEQLGFYHIVL